MRITKNRLNAYLLVFLCLLMFLVPKTVLATRLDKHTGYMMNSSAYYPAYSWNLGGWLSQWIAPLDWYDKVEEGSGNYKLKYPITVANGNGTLTETHWFEGAVVNGADGSAGYFTHNWDQTKWYNYVPSSSLYYNDDKNNYAHIYVSNNVGFVRTYHIYDHDRIMTADWNNSVLNIDYANHTLYYDYSNYALADWHYNRPDVRWSASGLKQGDNTVYALGSDEAGNYITDYWGFKYDTVAPYHSSSAVANVTSSGYDVYVYGVGDATSGVSYAEVGTWTKSDQSDLKWANATNLGGGTWKFHVDKANFGNATSNYYSNFWIYDNAGNAHLGAQVGPITLTKPDLDITAVSPANGTVFDLGGTANTVTYTIKNIGDQNAGAFYVKITSNGTQVVNAYKSGLAVGATTTVSYTIPSTVGTYNLVATADSTGSVAESNESNNTMSNTFTVTAADLDITAVSPASGSDFTLGGSANTVTWTVKNIGARNAGAFSIQIKQGTTVISTISKTGLAVGATTTVTTNVPETVGTYSYTVIADSGGTVPESNESNNSWSGSFDVLGANLRISAVSPASGSDFTLGGSANTVTWTIQNNGNYSAGAFSIQIKRGTTVISTISKTGLAVGATTTVTTNVPETVGTYSYTVIADSGGTVPESNEGDNSWSGSFDVLGANLRISAVSPVSGSEFIIDDSVANTVTWTIQNNGNYSAGAFSLKLTQSVNNGTAVDKTSSLSKTSITSLAAGGTTTVTYTIPEAVGAYSLTLTVDSGGAIPESNESDNVWSGNFSVVSNLSIIGTISPTLCYPGNDIDLTAYTEGWAGSVVVTNSLTSDSITMVADYPVTNNTNNWSIPLMWSNGGESGKFHIPESAPAGTITFLFTAQNSSKTATAIGNTNLIIKQVVVLITH